MSTRSHRARSTRSNTSSDSSSSYTSDHSRSTAPTAYSERPGCKHYDTSPAYFGQYEDEPFDSEEYNARTSVDTYASTVPSAEDLISEPQYDLPSERVETYSSDAVPTIPAEFAELFEPDRRIIIEHDDSTSDGNMNLRLDTEITISGGRRRKMTLFHLRMRDLRDRQFSLRRYCRESGREVCKSSRKLLPKSATADIQKPAKRPALQRSISSAISTLVGSKARAMASNKRYDPAEHSKEAPNNSNIADNLLSEAIDTPRATVSTNTIRLEFSNYAQVEVHPSGNKSSKRYDFEYWGTQYHWKREVRQDRDFRSISYHLVNTGSNQPIAHITPEPLTRRQAMDEEYKGGWIPPSSLFITDHGAFLTDLADVVVATGLMALVDDCIRRRWHSKSGVVMHVPGKKAADYITPKRLIDEIFNHRSNTTA